MGTVQDILDQKKSFGLLSTSPQETVLQATQRMNEHSVGALLVIEEQRIVGIFTERDVLRRVVALELVPSSVKVGEVMTQEVACCTLDTSIDEAQNLMRQYRVRHLPVVDEFGDVRGILSIGDLNAFHASNQQVEIHYLQEYLFGRV